MDLNYKLEKNQAVYIAKKCDKIDQKLCKYLNKELDRDKFKISFIRESEGVYRFGSKRIFIKLGHSGQLLVRVGGGFMSIDDFMLQYQDIETDKIGRKDNYNTF